MATPSLDALSHVGAALAAGLLALVTWPAKTRGARWLALFLLLIAANQAAETARAFAATSADEVLWFRVATVVAALDPLVLLLVVRALHGRDIGLRDALLVGAPAAAFATYAGWAAGLPSDGGGPERVFPILLSVYTLLVYGALTLEEARRVRAEPGATPALLAALLVAALPIFQRTMGQAMRLVDGAAIVLVLLVAASVAAAVLLVRLAAGRALRGLHLAIPLLVVAATAGNEIAGSIVTLGLLPPEAPAAVTPLSRAMTPVRWILFAAFASVALFRDRIVPLDLASRRRAARVLLGVSAAVLAAAIIELASSLLPAGERIRAGELLAIVVLVVMSQTFRRVVDAVARRVYGVPPVHDVAGAHAAYRQAASDALAGGRVPGRDPDLQRLRHDLGIDVETASVLERLAADSDKRPIGVGTLVGGRYRVEALLARGTGGRVHRARDLVLQRDVALKEVFPDAAGDAERAIAEARVAGALRHPHVVTLHDVVRRGDAEIMVLEYVEGGTLARRLQEGPLPTDEALRLLDAIAAGLAVVHAHGIVHGDVKPENVLLSREGAKLTDFGIARRRAGDTLGVGAGLGGTPGYMAPEVRRGGAGTFASDVYSFGVLLERCLPDAPLALRELGKRAQAEDPASRPQDGAALVRALADARRHSQ